MRIAELWRYPVKSMGGERLDTARLGPRGLHGDRLWAVRDLDKGETTTGRRIAAPLHCRARYAAEPPPGAGPGAAPEVLVTFPDGTERSSADRPAMDRALSDLCGSPVALAPLPPRRDLRAYRAGLQTPRTLRRDLGIPADEPLPAATVITLRKLATLALFTTPPGTFFDLFPLHVLTREGLAALAAAAPDGTDFDVRRFRPNVVLEGAPPSSPGDGTTTGDPAVMPEHGWAGATLTAAAGAAIRVTVPTIRCVVPTREQPGVRRDAQVMRTVARETGRFAGVYAECGRSGALAAGDEVQLQPPAPSTRAQRVARAATERTVAALQRLVPGA